MGNTRTEDGRSATLTVIILAFWREKQRRRGSASSLSAASFGGRMRTCLRPWRHAQASKELVLTVSMSWIDSKLLIRLTHRNVLQPFEVELFLADTLSPERQTHVTACSACSSLIEGATPSKDLQREVGRKRFKTLQ